MDQGPAAALLFKGENTIHTQTNATLKKLGVHSARQAVTRLFTPPAPLMEVVKPHPIPEEPSPEFTELLNIAAAPGAYAPNRKASVFWAAGSVSRVRDNVMREARKRGLRTAESLVMWGFATRILGGGTPVIGEPSQHYRTGTIHKIAKPTLVFEYTPLAG